MWLCILAFFMFLVGMAFLAVAFLYVLEEVKKGEDKRDH